MALGTGSACTRKPVNPSRGSSRGEVRARARVALAGSLALALCGAAVGPRLARADSPESALAAGPFAVLQAVLKKSVLRVEVARVQIRVDQATQRQLASLVSGRKRTDALADGVVRAVMASGDALITAELRRDVPLDKWAESVNDDLQAARQSGMVSENTYWSLVQQIPGWFKALRGRGPHKGDRLLCRVTPNAMRIVYRTRENQTLLDQTVPGVEAGRAVLASYLAPETTFRQELIDSLFGR